MLNGDDNENGSKTNRSNQQKKKQTNKLHVQHTFSSNQENKFAHATHFLYFQVAVVLDDYNAGLYD